jgi:hypothetical protein
MSWECGEGESCLTLDFAADTIRDQLECIPLGWTAGGLSLAHSRGRRHGRADDSSHAEG